MLWSQPERKNVRIIGTARKLLLLPLIVLVMLIHRIALLIDVFIFPRLRKTSVRKPLFIVGLPRSGTTNIHRLMASQTQEFTSMPLWELLFAPALCQKYLIWGMYKVDLFLGQPISRLLDWLQDRLASDFDDIHPTRLTDPEEDYLGLLPFDGCFLRFLMFPYSKTTWAIADFNSLPDHKKRKFLAAYRGLIKRHLVFRGENLRLLSKNPSFTTWVPDLAAEYPDAQFIATHRDLTQVVPSQLSSINEALGICGYSSQDPWIINQFVTLLNLYEDNIHSFEDGFAIRFKRVDFQILVRTPEVVMTEIYDQFQIPARNESDAARLQQLLSASRSYSSKHKYTLADFGLKPSDLKRNPTSTPIA